MIFPSTVALKKLNAMHPDFQDRAPAYDDFSILYEGGKRMRDKVTQFLRKRPKELSDVYLIRQLNFSYSNLLGNIVGWYRSSLFKTAPQLIKRTEGAEGEAALEIPPDAETFCRSSRPIATAPGLPSWTSGRGSWNRCCCTRPPMSW